MTESPGVRAHPSFARVAREVLEGKRSLDESTYRELLCSDCPFYHPGEEENLECGCYLLLKDLLGRGAVDLRRCLEALGYL